MQLTPSPALGQHNAAVLGEFLGLTPQDITGLLDRDVVADRPPA
jgi:crotonobetainyl-CoA:carnitine CoA-transferase CaiB-like acyl-CoA transferase